MNGINSKNLREFLFLSSSGSIAAAARGLFISPQALSKTIQNMETNLGVKLFTRTSKGLLLTTEGRILKEKAAYIIAELDSLKDLSEQAKEAYGYYNHVRMDLTNGSVLFFPIENIHEFERTHEDIKVSISEASDKEITARILNGERDIGFCVGPVDNTLFYATYLHSRKHCFVINKSNPLSKQKALRYADLKGENLIFPAKGSSAYNNNLNRCLKAGFDPNIVFCAADIQYAHVLSRQNFGIAISAEDIAAIDVSEETISVPILDEDCYMDIYMITARNNPRRPAVEELESFIKMRMGKH